MPSKQQDESEMVAAPSWQGDWEVNLSDWTTMEPILRWQELAQRSDFKALSEVMTTVIRRWPYAADPSAPTSYVKLTPAQWKAAVTQVGQAVGAFFQSAVD